MNATQLLAHFDRLAEAPDAVPRLRRFILDLAVRGKLVEQDGEDESVAAQLNDIRAARAIGIGDATPRARKASIQSEQNVLQFALPHGWSVVSLAELTDVLNGRAYAKNELLDAGTPVLRVGNLFTSKNWYYSDLTLEEDKYCDKGDLIFSWSASFGPFIWAGPKVIYHYHIWKLRLHSEARLDKHYLYRFLLQQTQQIKESGHGVSMVHMTKEKMEKLSVPLPPLAEQHRIVAKVDELMALCDQFEATQKDRERRRDHLAAASLQRLNQPAADTTPEAQREHARFHLQHLPRLTNRPEHIKALRQTILNLAVLGSLSESKDWALHSQPLKAAATLQNGYAFKSEWFAKSGIRLLRNTNVSHGVIRWDELACLPVEQTGEFERFTLIEGDVVLSLDRPFIGTGTKVARVQATDLPCLLLQRVGRFQLNPHLLTPGYLFLWIESPQFTDQIDPGRSNGVPHISSKQVESAEIFLPPLAEQQRIVAKVDELMALCDQLEAQLSITQTDSRRLLEAVLDAALTSV